MKKTLLAFSVLFAAAASAEGFMPWTEIMAKYDANFDGGVSMEEAKNHTLGQNFVGFQPFMVDHFAELDSNGDKMIDAVELAKMKQAMKWTDKDMVNQFYKNTGFMPTNPANR
jgi:hypothetical protein